MSVEVWVLQLRKFNGMIILYLFRMYVSRYTHMSRCMHASMCEGHRATFRSPRGPVQVIGYCGKLLRTDPSHPAGNVICVCFCLSVVTKSHVSQAGLSLLCS